MPFERLMMCRNRFGNSSGMTATCISTVLLNKRLTNDREGRSGNHVRGADYRIVVVVTKSADTEENWHER